MKMGIKIWRKCDSNEDPDCFNFVVPKEDIANRDQECFGFIRSAPVARHQECNLDPRDLGYLIFKS
jgi:hypothetical protein